MEREKTKKLNTSNINDSYVENNNKRIANIIIDDVNHKRRISLYSKNVLIYGWGKNKYGEIGIGHNTNINSPFPLKPFQNQLIKAISSGGKHTAVLLENGSIYLCGADVFNLLGTESRKWKEQHKFLKMTLLENEVIVQVACAEFHTICLNDKGEVFSWGGTLSRLGKQNTNKPFLVNSLLSRKIIEISCGDHHSAVLSDQGEIFTWGGGGQYNKGQCGHENLKEVENPKRVEFFVKNKKKAIKVVCGGYHSMVLCEDNHLFGFGKGTYGQLGYGGSEDSNIPKLVKFSKVFAHFEKDPNQIDFINTNLLENLTNLENNATLKSSFANAFSTNTVLIKDIKCGGEHTLVLSHQGRLYSFGHGYTGQLGQGNSQNCHFPMLVKSLLRKQISSIAAGWSHSMILTSQNYLYVAGCGKYGELGLEDDENRKNFTLLRSTMNLNISKISAGGHHSWIIVDAKSPEKPELQSPSPIGSGGNTPPSGGQSPKNIVNLNNNNNALVNNENRNVLNSKSKLDQKLRFDLDLLAGKFVNRERFILQVAYSDLRICHRFVRFAIPQGSRFKDISYRDLNSLMQNYFKSDRGVISFRLQDDSEVNFKNSSGSANIALDVISKEVRNNFKLNLNKKYFYSVVVVYDYTKNQDFLALKRNIEEVRLKENISSSLNKSLNQSLFDVINLNEEDIRTSEVEKILSGWVIDFHENFRELLEDPNEVTEDFPKYLELRPQDFYIS